MNKTPIYLFGGSFNPPHQGHINLLLDLQSQYQIDTITLLPNA
ncbi:MAG: nicotinate (nicotinamide) nucleotide adenylyltransferase, partial [Glaciecola sp.]